ncbi:PAS domain S-box protein [Lyngbya confervoides]|uniref:histidine kinase n=1 Tax=Lyngbya confervoides BDU141951 TaxID=1574623 RepID=A0ABD4T6C5_9CYAN|nr:PAS domain S-box protein [Lyngbya confervoides]MCM1983817.1 PAS domain S-box protein [Lyngbya confervoides BDU141951]
MYKNLAEPTKASILVVDDIPENLAVLNKILSLQGYEVCMALSGEIAIQSACTKKPDLVLLDILLPDMDGYTVCEAIKAIPGLQHIPIIFISSLEDPQNKVQAFNVGAADYLSKPVIISETISRIEYQLGLSHLYQSLSNQNENLKREIANIKYALDQFAAIAITDARGYITYVNDRFCQISKYAPYELLGKNHSIVNSGYHPRIFFQQLWQTISQGNVWKGEIQNRAKDSSLYWVDTVIIPILGETGDPSQYFSVCYEITERNYPAMDKIRAKLANWHRTQAEEQLRLLESVAINANDAVVITKAEPFDLPGPEIIYVNQAFTRMTGYSRDEIVGQTPRILQGPKTDCEARSRIRKALESWQPIQVELLNYTKEGTEFWGEISITPLCNEEGEVTHWISIQRDITERKEFELLLQSQAQIIDQIHDSVLILNLSGQINRWNCGAVKQFGYLSEHILGKSFSELMADEDQLEFDQVILPPLLTHGQYELELSLKTIHNHIFPARLSLSTLNNDQGKPVGVIAYIIDISKSKNAEEEILKSLNRERELNELKTRFVSMVSHEYRTPLTTILSSVDLLEYYDHCSDPEDKQALFGQIRTAVQRMTSLLNDVLLMSQSEAGKTSFNPKSLDLIDFCRELVQEFRQNIKTSHCLSLEFGDRAMPPVEMDEKILRHIFSNLIANAVKYTPQGGTINFKVAFREDSVQFSIQDSGIGIPEDSLQQIFQSFFRAENVGSIAGTGLGLSIVKRLVEIHQGSVMVQSQVGLGSTFTVILPLQLSVLA